MAQSGQDIVKIAVTGGIIGFTMQNRRVIFNDNVIFIHQTWIERVPEMIVIVMARQETFRKYAQLFKNSSHSCPFRCSDGRSLRRTQQIGKKGLFLRGFQELKLNSGGGLQGVNFL